MVEAELNGGRSIMTFAILARFRAIPRTAHHETSRLPCGVSCRNGRSRGSRRRNRGMSTWGAIANCLTSATGPRDHNSPKTYRLTIYLTFLAALSGDLGGLTVRPQLRALSRCVPCRAGCLGTIKREDERLNSELRRRHGLAIDEMDDNDRRDGPGGSGSWLVGEPC